MNQETLNLFLGTHAAENLQWLERVLDEAGHWLCARELANLTAGRIGDREIRALASSSESIISGQRGYRHIRHATAEEINHAASWLESQAKAMLDRSLRIRRRAHKLVG